MFPKRKLSIIVWKLCQVPSQNQKPSQHNNKIVMIRIAAICLPFSGSCKCFQFDPHLLSKHPGCLPKSAILKHGTIEDRRSPQPFHLFLSVFIFLLPTLKFQVLMNKLS